MKTNRFLVCVFSLAALAACGESSTSKSSGASPPVRLACTTPEQAGLKAADITRKLVEQKKQGAITPEQYNAFNSTMSQGFSAWAERQDLKSYCLALNKVVQDAGLK